MTTPQPPAEPSDELLPTERPEPEPERLWNRIADAVRAAHRASVPF